MQEALEGISRESTSRFRLSDVWELTRRFSGIAAIIVLGGAMLTLALRAETGLKGVTDTPALAAVTSPPPESSSALAVYQSAAPSLSSSPSLSSRIEPTIVYYLYATEEQRQMVLLAESIAGQEIATETVISTQRRFVALDASTLESEQAARDTIFEAMLLNDVGAHVIVQDLR